MSELKEFKQHIKDELIKSLEGLNDLYLEAKEKGDSRLCEDWLNVFINRTAFYNHGIFKDDVEYRVDITGYEIFKDGLAQARVDNPDIFIEGDKWLAERGIPTV